MSFKTSQRYMESAFDYVHTSVGCGCPANLLFYIFLVGDNIVK